MRTYEGIPSNSWNNNEDRNESVCPSANRCSIVKENETQILFPFFVFFFCREGNGIQIHLMLSVFFFFFFFFFFFKIIFFRFFFFFFFFFVTLKKTDFNFLFRFSFSYGILKTEYKSFCVFRFRPMAVKVIIFV